MAINCKHDTCMFISRSYIHNIVNGGVTTLTRPVSGEQQHFSGNMEILPGIGRVEKISGKHEIFSGHCMKKAGQDTTYF